WAASGAARDKGEEGASAKPKHPSERFVLRQPDGPEIMQLGQCFVRTRARLLWRNFCSVFAPAKSGWFRRLSASGESCFSGPGGRLARAVHDIVAPALARLLKNALDAIEGLGRRVPDRPSEWELRDARGHEEPDRFRHPFAQKVDRA